MQRNALDCTVVNRLPGNENMKFHGCFFLYIVYVSYAVFDNEPKLAIVHIAQAFFDVDRYTVCTVG